MAATTDLKWSTQLPINASTAGERLPGDKIRLPPSALEQLLSAARTAASVLPDGRHAPTYDPWNRREYLAYQQSLEERQDQLPQPLTFRLVNPKNGKTVYAGIQEFSAEEEHIIISPFLRDSLGFTTNEGASLDEVSESTETNVVAIHYSHVEKGTFVKLRPLEPGYDVEDWKSVLEQHLRANFTTLTKGEILEVSGEASLGKRQVFRFLIDEFKPSEDAICVVDTDLEVDIEALNEEQARETVKQIASKFQNGNGLGNDASQGGEMDLFRQRDGQVLPGSYVDYTLPSWPRDQPIEIILTRASENDDVDLLVSPFSARQRARPRLDEHVFADWEDRPAKRIRIEPTNVELEGAESLYIAIHAFDPALSNGIDGVGLSNPRKYTLKASVATSKGQAANRQNGEDSHEAGDVQCKNCLQWVPERTLMLHENFCLRNNILCSHGCGQVFQKRSEAYQEHWHCPHDTFFGDGALTHRKHDTLYHPPEAFHCTRCSTQNTFSSVPELALHHHSTCAGKIILCRFCHLAVPQGGDPDNPDPEALLSGLTSHELADGSRTTECHICGRITRMRDMETHLKHHDLQRKSRPRPRVCRNVNCGNTLDGANHAGSTNTAKDPGNDIGLCGTCFSPLYVTLNDPEGKALKRRIERRYLQQMMTGCGKSWCHNDFCRAGRKHNGLAEEGTSAKTAIPLIKPFVDGSIAGTETPLQFCVDEGSQGRRQRALMIEAEGKQMFGNKAYAFPWCIAAFEAEGGDIDKARTWLDNYAPRIEEERL